MDPSTQPTNLRAQLWSHVTVIEKSVVVPSFYTLFWRKKKIVKHIPVLVLFQNGEFTYQYQPDIDTHICISAF